MKNKLIIWLVSVFLILCTTVSASGTNPYGKLVDNKSQIQIGFSYYPMKNGMFFKEGRIFVSLREVAELLGIPVEWDVENEIGVLRPEHKRVKILTDESKEIDAENFCAVPDEDIAYKIAKAVLEGALQEEVVFESGKWRSDLRVVFYESTNSWLVIQDVYYKGEFYRPVNANNYVYINKNTGEIEKLVLYKPEYEEIEKIMSTQE